MHDVLEEKILPFVLKPARYTGSELNSIHKKDEDDYNDKIKIALSYPDTYEIGMSNYGLQILYHILNKRQDVACERVFAPWPDMEQKLKEQDIPLFSLESQVPIKDFDILGFSLENELTYTNVLYLLESAKIPLHRRERDKTHPLIIAGGACTNNPLPMSDFIDAFVIGDGEEVILEMIDVYIKYRGSRPRSLEALSKIEGVYVPDHNELKSVKRRIVKDINTIDYPTRPIVPFIEIVHDRAAVEIMRGCPRRCAFCQAGNTTKPVRLLSPEKIKELSNRILENTGFEELSFISLSSSDYPGLIGIAKELGQKFAKKRISISLPSLRPDSFKKDMAGEIQNVRRSGVTLAPEAGTQRLRDLICKDLTEEEIISSCVSAFSSGANSVKLYFMIGLPTETEEDIKAIVELSNKIIGEGKRANPRARITVNASTFVPKKNTPFENEKMISLEETRRKQDYLKHNLKHRGIELKWHSPEMSSIEGLLSAGDEKTGQVIKKAFDLGCRFDNWTEYFDFSKWEKALAENKNKI
ncbi:MAG: TIGR03960 family B12-binding radical SAM protein [Candidatus Saganbacteria bacterium]|nr:TIGR03960 family B12-binding radical SAM protein [Candidatus Saganbacteria bacterium]